MYYPSLQRTETVGVKMEILHELLTTDFDVSLCQDLIDHIKADGHVHIYAAPFHGGVLTSILVAKNLGDKCLALTSNSISEKWTDEYIKAMRLSEHDSVIVEDGRFPECLVEDGEHDFKLIVSHIGRTNEMHILDDHDIVAKIIDNTPSKTLQLTWLNAKTKMQQLFYYDLSKLPELK